MSIISGFNYRQNISGNSVQNDVSDKKPLSKSVRNGIIAVSVASTTSLAVIFNTKLRNHALNIIASPKLARITDNCVRLIDNYIARPRPKKVFTKVEANKLYRGPRPINLEKHMFFLTNHEYSISKNIENFERLSKHNIKVIVDFSQASELTRAKEAKMALKYDIKYKNIALNPLRRPSDTDIKEFFKIMHQTDGAVYIHCLNGRDRTGFMAALYDITKNNKTFDDAFLEMKSFDHDEKHYPELKKFLKEYATTNKHDALKKELREILQVEHNDSCEKLKTVA